MLENKEKTSEEKLLIKFQIYMLLQSDTEM